MNINPNNPPPPGVGGFTVAWLVATVEYLKRRINALTGGGGTGGTLAIGETVVDGTPNNILFIGSDGNLAQDSNFTYSFGNLETLAGAMSSYSDAQRLTMAASYLGFDYYNGSFAQGLKFEDPGADRIATLPNETGTILTSAQKGIANGIATLDSGGTVPISQLPYSVAEFKGVWNAATNTPSLSDASGNNGDFYTISVGAVRNLGSGNITFVAGNTVIYNGALAIWQQTGPLATGTVTSVSGNDSTWVSVANGSSAAVITINAAPKLARIDTTPILINNVAFDGSVNVLLNSSYNNQTGTTYIFVLADNQKVVTGTNAAAQTYTVPANGAVAFPIGARIDITQDGAGAITFAPGSGVTINSFGGALTTAGQWAAVTLLKKGTNTWHLIGNLA